MPPVSLKFQTTELFGSLNRNFAELFEEFRKFQRRLASASTGSFITFYNLSFGICLKVRNLSVNFLY